MKVIKNFPAYLSEDEKTNPGMTFNTNINNISQTAFLTLQCHAKDAGSKNPILNDHSSINTIDKLKESFRDSGSSFFKKMAGDKIRKTLVVHTAHRARRIFFQGEG